MKRFSVFLLAIILLMPASALAVDAKQAKDSAVSAVKSISFDKGFLGKVNERVSIWAEKTEVFRKEKKESFQKSLDTVDARRAREKDAKPAVKAITFIHILVLATVLFIFSLQFVFYTVCALLAIWIVRKLFLLVKRAFRRGN